MDNNESSIILENNTNETAIKINEEENYIKNDTVVNNINDINKCENRKLETEDIDKLIHLDDELFLYHENSIKNDGDETILDYKNDDANENKNYIATSDDSYINISENSFKIIKNELKFKHKINVISEESEIEESENKNNDFSNEGSDEVSKNSLPIENDMNKITKENKISKELENESFNMNLNFSRDLENERNNNEIKYVNSPENESMLKHDFSNGSLTFFKRDNNISKEFNDNESYNFETTSMVDNKSINSIYSLNKELNDNPNDNQSIKTSNEAFIIQSIDFSRSKTNYSYNNDFDYTLNFERAKDYLQTYKEISDDENSKNFLLFKPFYTIANGVIAKQLNDNEQISDSSFYTSHAGYINVIKKKVTLDLIWNNNLTQVYFLMFLIHKDLKLAYIFVRE
ncbi:hypothetical protein BCR36DRAFT_272286 [Piromyces finnis]|uniref:Uncharacterized protein n=1 Tax=Piromyces finnis TaxID=1754191 RepID=A0A1Y1VNN3_9FUNG|nr:hypothetical protein BCR36DRAFT_272286 [Piromyces finnis]|eukprot:ORX61019.1 hypothetical protein BCR36DRAFT_272286 [Piromyces finnis]